MKSEEAKRLKELDVENTRHQGCQHVVANIALPTTISLFSRLRERLLEQLGVFDGLAAEDFQISIEQIRERTAVQATEVQLRVRVELLQDILAKSTELKPPEHANTNPAWQKLQELKQLAIKDLSDQADPSQA